ncbi:efflux RND transporter periplasmic adaptor subunit [Wujia chipingensis]|uniref:Efflux RND transporter periplasmic adaptor subunit n=1 Tax=Wujia chipingensis TaxID=2763670 RepID=A0A7G9FQ88_9FIRM|nr:efflux RND transporter periplasmic adaptor subunit [Wujia chipingensis]QNM00720.1 efflux RND transporter periplasmic adaptor subunit [Wujia chipingensis]
MKKKGIIILIVVLLVLAGAAGAIYYVLHNKKASNEELVYATKISDLNGGYDLTESRYMGTVESQEVKGVNRDSDKKVKELYVKEEDEVKAGEVLFEYDTESMELQLRQLELELTSINNNIATLNQQIASLTTEKAAAPAEEQLSYSAQIQNLQAQVNQANYDASAKQLEIDRQKLSMENTKVVAPMDGIIKTINENNSTSSSDDDSSNSNSDNGSDSTSNAYITIMAKGDYRIKATASELTVRSMSEGQSMIIRSRVDDSTWTGTVTKIDLEHPDNGNNNDYYMSSGTTATKYPFYISLDSTDGLMLGQHVYVEADYGQGDVKEGLWLDEYYIMQEDDGAYVWAENAKGYIEKRKVELGEYDENMMRYQILSGLTEDDYIAYPEDRVKEGMKVTHNYEDVVIDDTVEDATGGDSLYDDGYTDDGSVDGYTDDGILDDGSINNIDDGANTDGIDGSVEEAAPQDESAPDSDSEVVQ